MEYVERRGRRVSIFPHVPMAFKHCLYVIELETGVVKIGYTGNPRARIHALGQQIRREFKTKMVRAHFGADLGGEGRGRTLEMDFIRAVASRAQPLPGRLEFFTGIDFDTAVPVCDGFIWKES
jgi:hypothetical protein